MVGQANYPGTHDGLRQICGERLRTVLDELRARQGETIVNSEIQTPRRLRHLRRLVKNLDDIEMIGVTALSAAPQDLTGLNIMVREICDELQYPLIAPTVANLSTSYFGIYAEYNLLMVPLLEDRYLLHLPDLYHELAHPLLHDYYKDNAGLDTFRDAMRLCFLATRKHTAKLLQTAQRERSASAIPYYYHVWQRCWERSWLEELFCDLFATITVGPAYGWSHLHLTAKRGQSPFEIPLHTTSSHPPDDVRMRVVLLTLNQLGFVDEAKRIGAKWNTFLLLSDIKPSPEYKACFAEPLLQTLATEVRVGVEGMGVETIAPGAATPWAERLNLAWDTFWASPESYGIWEQGLMKQLQPLKKK